MSGTLIAAILGPFAPVLGVAGAWLNLRSTQSKNHEAIKDHITQAVTAAAALPARDTGSSAPVADAAEVTINITMGAEGRP